ncbi:hypothetical protein DPMN_151146, partial [Dreissena polymorpha]
VTVLTSPKAERDQVESSLYSDGQLQISFNARIFIINPLNKLVTLFQDIIYIFNTSFLNLTTSELL